MTNIRPLVRPKIEFAYNILQLNRTPIFENRMLERYIEQTYSTPQDILNVISGECPVERALLCTAKELIKVKVKSPSSL